MTRRGAETSKGTLLFIEKCTSLRAYMHTCMHAIDVHTNKHTCIHTYMHTHIHVCVCVRVCVCVCERERERERVVYISAFSFPGEVKTSS
jgi:hypothetical protein